MIFYRSPLSNPKPMHILRWLALSLACFPAFLYAQTPEAWVRLPAEFTGNTEVHAFPDANGLTLLFRQGNSVQLTVMDPQGRVIHRLSGASLPASSSLKPVGYANTPEALYVVYRDESTGDFLKYALPKAPSGETFAVARMAEPAGNDAYWGSFTVDGALHVLRLPRTSASNALRICRFQPGGEFSAIEVPVTRKDFFKRARYEFTQVTDTSRLSPFTSYLPGKMYPSGNQLLLSVDAGDTTHFVSVNLLSGDKREFEWIHSGFGRDGGALRPDYRGATCLLGDRLWHLAFTGDSARLQVHDFSARRVLAEWRLARNGGGWWPEARFSEFRNDSLKAEYQDAASVWTGWPGKEFGLAVTQLPGGTLRVEGGLVTPNRIRGVSGVAIKEVANGNIFSVALDPAQWIAAQEPVLVNSALRRATEMPLRREFMLNGRKAIGYYDVYSREYVVYFP